MNADKPAALLILKPFNVAFEGEVPRLSIKRFFNTPFGVLTLDVRRNSGWMSDKASEMLTASMALGECYLNLYYPGGNRIWEMKVWEVVRRDEYVSLFSFMGLRLEMLVIGGQMMGVTIDSVAETIDVPAKLLEAGK